MSNYLKDLSERVLKTFLASFLGAVTVPQLTSLDVTAIQAGALAGLSAVVTVIVGILAKYAGSPEDASLLSK